jgi:hypothetical protein
MSKSSQLSLQSARHGRIAISDILINGKPLVERIRQHEGGQMSYVSPLGWIHESFERLVLQSPPDLPGGRTSILVCSQCGDLGCGAVSAVIIRDGDEVIWGDLGIANNLGIDDGNPWLFEKVRSFKFSWVDYTKALNMRAT